VELVAENVAVLREFAGGGVREDRVVGIEAVALVFDAFFAATLV